MIPDTTAISAELTDPIRLITFIGGILGGIFAIIFGLFTVIPKIKQWWTTNRDRQSLRKRLGAELYTAEDIKNATQYYIKPNCQDVDPAQEEEIRLVHGVQADLFENVDKLLSNPDKYKYLILLADSGMGKTSFVLNYYARHWRHSRRRRKFNLTLVPLGIKNADSQIEKIKDRSNTVLFLDAFDEDTLAIKDHRERLGRLLSLSEGFRQVLITSRTQFFLREEEIPRETGIIKVSVTAAGESHEHQFYKLYLSPFSDEQVEKYLKRRFPLLRRKQCRLARNMVQKIPLLTVRPMILAHIQDLVQSGKTINFAFQLYEEMVEAWLERERPFVKNKDDLRRFSEDLAIDLYLKREQRGSERVHYTELETIAQTFGIRLQAWQMRGRSLLNR
ncbi:MAG: hypothetical protein JSW07_10280, partial [bacterium]